MKIEVPAFDLAKQWRALVAECLATLMLVFFGCMSCIPMERYPHLSQFYGSLGFGLATMISIQSFAHISGSLMNPVVTIVVVIWKKMPVTLGLLYIIAECAGAIIGYGLLVILVPVNVAAEGICVTAPHNVTDLQALGIEVMLSLAISFLNCSVFDPLNAHNLDSFPLKFGFGITALGLVGSHWTGGGMNPVRSLGPAVWANRWDAHWVYWFGPMLGGIGPAVIYKYVWLQPKEKMELS